MKVAYFAARARDTSGCVPWKLVDRGDYAYRTDNAEQRIRLLAADSPTHVTHMNRIWRLEVTHEQFHEPVYRADADPVANV